MGIPEDIASEQKNIDNLRASLPNFRLAPRTIQYQISNPHLIRNQSQGRVIARRERLKIHEKINHSESKINLLRKNFSDSLLGL